MVSRVASEFDTSRTRQCRKLQIRKEEEGARPWPMPR
jgi:hypothetical protein